jgi:hypothetical protein
MLPLRSPTFHSFKVYVWRTQGMKQYEVYTPFEAYNYRVKTVGSELE